MSRYSLPTTHTLTEWLRTPRPLSPHSNAQWISYTRVGILQAIAYHRDTRGTAGATAHYICATAGMTRYTFGRYITRLLEWELVIREHGHERRTLVYRLNYEKLGL